MAFVRTHFFILILFIISGLFLLTHFNRSPFIKHLENTSKLEKKMNRAQNLNHLKKKPPNLSFNREEARKISSRLHLLFSLSVGTIVFLIGYVFFGLIHPLQNLNKKMMDFLNGKYSYRPKSFSPNEIGALEETFHALAQKIIFKMEEFSSLNQTKSEFLSIASHEIRTPLTSIKGSLNLLKLGVIGKLDPPSLELIRVADEETDRLIRLINDILDLTKIESGYLKLEKKWEPLTPLIEQVLYSITGLASKMEITLQMESLNPISVYIDKDRIHQVLTNLLSNAIKHSPRGGIVLVKTDLKNGKTLRINVIDQGAGIQPKNQKLIFEKFNQEKISNHSSHSPIKSTGLGLTISKALVEQHGGTIEANSNLGKGSVFYFILPEWRWERKDMIFSNFKKSEIKNKKADKEKTG